MVCGSKELTCFMLTTSVTVALVGTTLGYDVGIMTEALTLIKKDFNFGNVDSEVIDGSLTLFAAPGAIIGASMADSLPGRKGVLIAACGLYVLGALLACWSVDIPVLIAGRIISGIGVGFAFSAPVYLAELAPSSIRASLISLFDASIDFGILVGYLVGATVDMYVSGETTKWRLMLGLAAVLPTCVLIGSPFLPESPRWLLANSHTQEARKVLRMTLPPAREELVEQTIREFEKEMELQDDEEPITWIDMFFISDPIVRQNLFVALAIGFFQQANGSESLLYYSYDFLEKAGMSSATALALGYAAIGLSKFLPDFIPIIFADTYGRVPFLVASCWGIVLALLGLTITSAASGPAVVSVVFMCAFFVSFSLGIAPLSWVYASEVLPYRYRAKGLLLMVFVNRLTSAAVALTALTLINRLGTAGFFGLYLSIAFIGAIFISNSIQETKQFSLEQLASENHRPETEGSLSRKRFMYYTSERHDTDEDVDEGSQVL